MSARLLAPCCLLILAVSPGWTGGDSSSSPDLVVYLKTTLPHPPGPLGAMKRELTTLMSSAGFRLDWRDERSANRNVENAELVLVELRGICGLSSRAAPNQAEPVSLASTAVSAGRVLPFSWLNCDALTRVLAPALAGDPSPQQDFLYGRAMARLLAHELYHITTQNRGHGRTGLAKPAFTRRELLGDRFDFAAATLAQVSRYKVP